jgi:hypothetical protein
LRSEEAAWIGSRLVKLAPRTVLELGSSTREFRTREQPHIERCLHAPLRASGARIVHADMKAGEGIDISGDLYDPAVQAALATVRPDVVLCCNIFEHVSDRGRFAQICDSLLPPGGIVVVSVPRSFPYHPDPLDTYYRPSPEELAQLFPTYRVLDAETVTSSSYASEVQGPRAFAKTLAKIALVRGGLDATRARAHRLLWLFRPYRLSVVILQKPGKT